MYNVVEIESYSEFPLWTVFFFLDLFFLPGESSCLAETELGVSDKQCPFVKYGEVLPYQRFEECAVDRVAIFETFCKATMVPCGMLEGEDDGQWYLTCIQHMVILNFCLNCYSLGCLGAVWIVPRWIRDDVLLQPQCGGVG